jgi:type VI secretion system protein ImpA
VARGERSPLADQATATLDLLGAVLQDAGEDYRNLRLQEAHLVVEGIDRIRKAFRRHASGSEPDLDDLQSIVKKAIEVLAGQAKAESVNPQVTDQEPGAPRASGGGSGQLANRADAKKALNAIADFLERIEPAHPAPLFIRRAANLIDMNFMEIMKNMAPSSLDGIRHLGGLEDDN